METTYSAKKMFTGWMYRDVYISHKQEFRSNRVRGYRVPPEYKFTIGGETFSRTTLKDAKVTINALLGA